MSTNKSERSRIGRHFLTILTCRETRIPEYEKFGGLPFTRFEKYEFYEIASGETCLYQNDQYVGVVKHFYFRRKGFLRYTLINIEGNKVHVKSSDRVVLALRF